MTGIVGCDECYVPFTKVWFNRKIDKEFFGVKNIYSTFFSIVDSNFNIVENKYYVQKIVCWKYISEKKVVVNNLFPILSLYKLV